MDQVVQMIQDRTGLDEAKARTAVDTVLGFVKEKLPEPIAGQIDNLMAGGEAQGSPIDRASGMFK